MDYIIIFNAESDFIRVNSMEQASKQIADLIKEGYSLDEIELCEVINKEFEVEISSIIVTIKEGA